MMVSANGGVLHHSIDFRPMTGGGNTKENKTSTVVPTAGGNNEVPAKSRGVTPLRD